MNVYFEIADSLIDDFKGKYLVQNDVEESVYNEITCLYPRNAMWNSNRVWAETEYGVKYLKNRIVGDDKEVDMKEFMWIKLRAQAI
jgi:hypothetical protein